MQISALGLLEAHEFALLQGAKSVAREGLFANCTVWGFLILATQISRQKDGHTGHHDAVAALPLQARKKIRAQNGIITPQPGAPFCHENCADGRNCVDSV